MATRADLEARLGRTALDRAVEGERLVRVGRGRFALPGVAADRRRAHALNGVLSHESAALHHGWPVLLAPEQPHVTLPVRRRVTQERSRDVTLHRVDLHPDEARDGLTSPDRTMLDCLRACSFPSALAVADSALRQGRTPGWLARVAAEAKGHGARQARRVALAATDLAANPFESGLRAAALDVPGLTVRPQVPLHAGDRFIGRPDLVDVELGIVLEADSFEWHGGRSALVRDARRYNELAVAGWLVLRFTWEDVVLEPERVRGVLELATKRRCQSRERPPQVASRAIGTAVS